MQSTSRNDQCCIPSYHKHKHEEDQAALHRGRMQTLANVCNGSKAVIGLMTGMGGKRLLAAAQLVMSWTVADATDLDETPLAAIKAQSDDLASWGDLKRQVFVPANP